MTLDAAFVLMFACFSVGFSMGIRRAWRDAMPNEKGQAQRPEAPPGRERNEQ